jgi:RNA polymerase primary sigma factor
MPISSRITQWTTMYSPNTSNNGVPEYHFVVYQPENQSVKTYLNGISKVKLISAEEEVSLAQKVRQDDKTALEKLCKANLRFVVSLGKKYQHQGLSLSELICDGILGLIKAAQKFDDTQGFRFISFAV